MTVYLELLGRRVSELIEKEKDTFNVGSTIQWGQGFVLNKRCKNLREGCDEVTHNRVFSQHLHTFFYFFAFLASPWM